MSTLDLRRRPERTADSAKLNHCAAFRSEASMSRRMANGFSASFILAKSLRNLFTKSLAPKNFLKKGTILTSEMITLKKPGTGINSSDLKKLIGKKLKKDVNPNRLFKNEDFYE